ncbi:MAG: FecR family protein, partial [Terriglobales bacterium]
MEVKFKFIAAVIAGFLFAIPGMVMAQNPDLSQNPTPQGQAPVNQNQVQPQNQMQAPAQDQMQDQEQDQDSMQDQGQSQSQDQAHPAPKLYGPDDTQQDQQQQDQNGRPPMSEQPPKPSPNIQAPSMQRPGPYGYPPYGYPPNGNRPYGNPRGNPNNGNQSNQNESAENNGVARVSMIHGDVSTQRGDSGDWSAAQVNAPVVSGDKVSTGDKARVELQLDYANILRLSEHTQANITNLTRSTIQIQLGKGMANYTVLGKSEGDAEIDTPNVAIRTERRNSSFRVLVTADDHTEVLVRRGEVEITTPQGGTRVGENQFITIQGSADQAQYRVGEAPARDDWDQWNTDRDRMIDGSASRRHTNDYYVGSQDLDNNGTWKNVPDYGQVWQPNVGADWAPYRDGRWVWEPYWGWTWVSYEPWGWAPYHYGRWMMLDGGW